MKSGWTSSGLKSLSLPYATSSWDASKNSNTRRAQSLKVLACNLPHDAVFLNKNDLTGHGGRESLMLSGLERWQGVSSCFNAKTVIRVQFDFDLTALGTMTLLADVCSGGEPATLLKKVRSVERMCSHFGFGNFPPDEPYVYQFFTEGRNKGIPPLRLEGVPGSAEILQACVIHGQTWAGCSEPQVHRNYNCRCLFLV